METWLLKVVLILSYLELSHVAIQLNQVTFGVRASIPEAVWPLLLAFEHFDFLLAFQKRIHLKERTLFL